MVRIMQENCDGVKNENLFQKMEAERAQIPNILRDEFLPVFVVKCLREKMVSNRFGQINGEISSEDLKWTPELVLEVEGPFLLSQENLNFAGKYLKFARNALNCFAINRNRIGQCFTDEFQFPCLELLYLMDKVYQLLPLTNYLMWLEKSSKMNYFKRQFIEFMFSPEAFSYKYRERSMKILQHFLQSIILAYYCNPCSKPYLHTLKENSGDILSQIVTKLISEENCQVVSANHKIILLMLTKDINIPESVRSRCISDNIKNILRSGSKPFHGEVEILQYQQKYAEPGKMFDLDMFTLATSQMISAVNTNDIFSTISSVLSSPDFNWEMLLYFVNIWMREKQNSTATLLKDLTKNLIRNGLLSRDKREVAKGFIIARHCSSIASETFSRYEKWFSNCFNSEIYSIAKEPETFTFFIETLTQWVPAEPSCFLSVHISFWPFIPKGCKEFWNDYLSVAKVRISEYKEVEAAMEYEPNLNDPVQHEVAMAIKAFESRGKMPQSIIKMYIFSKQHYLKAFLPELLRKPTNVSLTDSRLRLIELLKHDGKIPEDMYMEYKSTSKAS